MNTLLATLIIYLLIMYLLIVNNPNLKTEIFVLLPVIIYIMIIVIQKT